MKLPARVVKLLASDDVSPSALRQAALESVRIFLQSTREELRPDLVILAVPRGTGRDVQAQLLDTRTVAYDNPDLSQRYTREVVAEADMRKTGLQLIRKARLSDSRAPAMGDDDQELRWVTVDGEWPVC